MGILGLHHVTAMCGSPRENVVFYAGLLGLRLVKVTENYDDPGAYHLYYGDGRGSPGSVMTFFPWPSASRGRVGAGQVVATALSVPEGSLPFWSDRLAAHRVVGSPHSRLVSPGSRSQTRMGCCSSS